MGITVNENLPNVWWVFLLMAIFMVYYVLFVLYLVGCLLVVLGRTSVLRIPYIGPYMNDDYNLDGGAYVDPTATVNDIIATSSSYNSIS